MPYGMLVLRQFFLSLSGVCVCRSDGRGVAGQFADAMPSWDTMHEVDWQMLSGACAAISGKYRSEFTSEIDAVSHRVRLHMVVAFCVDWCTVEFRRAVAGRG